MASLPARSILDGTGSPTTSAMKSALGQLRDFLAGLLGTTGEVSDALGALGIAAQPTHRNLVINGDMSVSQIGSASAVAGSYTYGGADMMLTSINATLTSGAIAQLSTGPSIGGAGYSHALTATTSTAGTVLHQTRIPSRSTRRANGKKLTISASLYQDTGATISASLQLATPTSTADTHSALTTLQTSGTYAIPSGVLTEIVWTTTALGASDATKGLAVTAIMPFAASVAAKVFSITDLQVEIGEVKTDFEYRDDQLERCQEFLDAFPSGTLDFIGSNYQAAQNNSYTVPMKRAKYKPPQFGSGWTLINGTSITAAILSQHNVVLQIVNTSAGQWRLTNSTLAIIDARL